MAEPARAELIKFLNGPAVEVVPIAARIGLQIDAEATEKKCNFVLYSTMTQKTGSSSTKKGFLHGATSMAGMLPMLGAARRVGGAVAVTAASSAMSGIAEAASTVKARDEWTFSYKLAPAGNAAAPVLESSAAGKAKADGENVISLLLREAAEAVLTKVMTKSRKLQLEVHGFFRGPLQRAILGAGRRHLSGISGDRDGAAATRAAHPV